MKRILTAIIAGGALLALMILVPDGHGFLGICILLSFTGLLEYYRINGLGNGLRLSATIASCGLAWLGCWEIAHGSKYEIIIRISFLFLLMPALATWKLFLNPGKLADSQAGILFTGILYALVPFCLFYMLAGGLEFHGNYEYEFRIPLGILILTWCSDTFAYFGGKLSGKRKLYVKISPGKTWEGLISGTAFCVAAGFILQETWEFQFSGTLRMNWPIVAAIVAVFTPVGDLVESMIKRSLNIKDSGSILPGHGGVLDRFDGPLLSIPVIFFALCLFAIANS